MKIAQWAYATVALLIVMTLVAAPATAAMREYWIAADEVEWNFAPSFPTNLMTGQPFTDDQRVFVEEAIGRIYTKSLYREYTANFGSLKTRGPAEEHLGTLGPVIRAAVGDTIVVHFKNNTAFPASIHPHGVFYTKENEGAPYADGTSGTDKNDDAVPANGGTHTYTWQVPDRAGPAPNDPTSIVWLYHSHTDETRDTNAGLIGPMVIVKRGLADFNGVPKDVDREFFSLYTVFNENSSIQFEANLSKCTVGPQGVPCDPEDGDFEESNLMHTINGLVFGNNTGYAMKIGERVRWYIMAMGTEVDLHSPHWHGVTLIHNGNRIDVTEVLPASTRTLDLRPDNPGTWMFHCHVNDHIDAGMMTKFTINP